MYSCSINIKTCAPRCHTKTTKLIFSVASRCYTKNQKVNFNKNIAAVISFGFYIDVVKLNHVFSDMRFCLVKYVGNCIQHRTRVIDIRPG